MTDPIIDELIASTKAQTKIVRVCGRGDLVDRHNALVAQLAETSAGGASLAGDSKSAAISQQIVDVEEEMDEATVTIVLGAVDRMTWTDLLARHRPTDEQRLAGDDHNPKTFPPAALAACAVNPKITDAQAVALAGKLPTGEWLKLWQTLLLLNVAPLPHPKLAAATEIVQANAPSATSSPGSESLAPRSSAGSGDPSPSTTATAEGS